MPDPNIYALSRQIQNDILDKTYELFAGVNVPSVKAEIMKSHIIHCIKHKEYNVEGFFLEDYSISGLADMVYNELAGYSVLTAPLNLPDLEELNVNGWDDVDIRLAGGIVKKGKPFASAEHARDVIRRMLAESGVTIDNAMPMAEGYLQNNLRITVVEPPVADNERGATCSIRKLRPYSFDAGYFLQSGLCSPDMLEFLETCLRFGVSFVVAGSVGTGKTTLLNHLLLSVPDKKRIVTIEQGSRELQLIRRDPQTDVVVNNVVHLLSRPSENPNQNVTQEMLVAKALRYDPDVIAIGEMRDTESYAAQEASLTGHTVVTSVHAGSARLAHNRVAGLCRKKYITDHQTALVQASEAFPVTVFVHQLEDNSRKIMDITECVIDDNGNRQYRTLYEYKVERNEKFGDKVVITGEHQKVTGISKELAKRLRLGGAESSLIERFEQSGLGGRFL